MVRIFFISDFFLDHFGAYLGVVVDAFGEPLWHLFLGPVANNNTSAGQAKNRRVEVQIFDRTDIRPGVAPSKGDINPEMGATVNTEKRQETIPLAAGNISVAADTPWVDGAVLAPARKGNEVLFFVDGRVVILGSANINDRSMIGSRDTELNATVVDRATTEIMVDGKSTKVRTLAHNLRVKLWAEHLGLSNTSSIIDPVANVGHNLWNKTATDNTRIYEQVFPNIPSDNHQDRNAQAAAAAFIGSRRALLSGIRGHLTLFPLDWLRNEDLEASGPVYSNDIFTFLHLLKRKTEIA